MVVACPVCGCEFDSVRVFVTHYRHVHTDYEGLLVSGMAALKGVKLSSFQKRCFARNRARDAVREKIDCVLRELGVGGCDGG